MQFAAHITSTREANGMQETVEGTIVVSVVEPIDDTDMKAGFITVKTSEDDYVKLEVGSYTTFVTLEEGENVLVQAETMGSTGVIYAKSVILTERSAR
jgi:hypothetical protein